MSVDFHDIAKGIIQAMKLYLQYRKITYFSHTHICTYNWNMYARNPCLSQNAKGRGLLGLPASVSHRTQHSHPGHPLAPPSWLRLPAESHILIKYRCCCQPLSGSRGEFINSRCRQPVLAVTLEEGLLFHSVVLMMLQETEQKVECEVAS